jgi:4-aminobutyrate aminotransferase-like enzyme/Ser/Thr protein kinase RdoA (MazF antagonist)
MSSPFPPSFSADAAAEIARTHFGIAAAASALPSERDQNFLLRTDAGEKYVLKIAQAGENPDLLTCQNEVLGLLQRADSRFRFPRVLPSASGETIARVAGAASEHQVRLVDYLPGEPLALVRPHSAALLRDVGSLCGTVDRALASYSHPASCRELQWDMRSAAAVITQHLDSAARDVRPHLAWVLTLLELSHDHFKELRCSVIHNDGNDYNLIVRAPTATDPFEPMTLVGLIDFGDLLYSWTISEVAVAAAYAMLGKQDPMAAAAEVVAGYHHEFAIPEHELAAVFPLICARIALSLTLAAVQRGQHPDNEYLSISEVPARVLLGQLVAIDPSYAHFRLRAACGLEPCPASARVVQWLREHGNRAAAILPDHDLRNARVLDFSVQSLEFGEQAGDANPEIWNDAISAELNAHGASAGIGRYDEARPWYTTPAFQDSAPASEWRTVHIGIDLFAEPGTAVCAPFAGTIHSFRNNAAHLDYGPTVILQHDVAPGASFWTLYGHLTVESLDALRVGAEVRQGERFAEIGAADVNGGWAPHLHFQIITDLLGRSGEFPGVARPSERTLWLSLAPDPNLIVNLPQLAPAPRVDGTALRAERASRVGPSLSIAYRKPLTIVRGWRQHLYDDDGQPYLDAVNNVAHVGHSHPRVVAALRRQAAVLNTNTRYLHENLVRYAERLTATLPEPLRVCYFVCSGSEANELALRLARAHTGAHDVIVIDGAYHGNTSALIELSPYKFKGPGGAGQAPHVQVLPLPDPYRGLYRARDREAGGRYAAHVPDALAKIHARGQRAAAFFAEPLLGCGGQIVLPDDYLAQTFAHVRAAGGVCIADEVQTGLGRVGSHFWAFETQGVVPDIVTVGKPIGNGHPLGAVITTAEIAASFANGMEYFNTFGGNPVSCAVGMAVLDVIAEEDLQNNALRVGTVLLEQLRALQAQHEIVGDVRGLGLYIGVELVLDREQRTPAGVCASYVANRMRELGVLLSTDGPDHNVLKIKPPLVFTEGDADRLVTTLDHVLSENAVQIRSAH